MRASLLTVLAALAHLPCAAAGSAPPPPPLRPAPAAPAPRASWALARFTFQATGLCLGLHLDPGSYFPCDGGAGNSCPTELLPCSAPRAVWNVTTDGYLCSAYEGPGAESACVNVDCDSSEPGAVVKVIAGPTQWFSQLAFSAAAGGQLVYTSRSGMIRCLGLPTAATPPTPPCNAGEEYLANGTVIDYCQESSTQGWAMLPGA